MLSGDEAIVLHIQLGESHAYKVHTFAIQRVTYALDEFFKRNTTATILVCAFEGKIWMNMSVMECGLWRQ